MTKTPARDSRNRNAHPTAEVPSSRVRNGRMLSNLLGGESAIYPGHPVTLAYLIINAYPSFADATRKSDRALYPAALSNGDIPGAGGNVYAALDLLRKVVIEQVPIDAAIDRAKDMWARCDSQATGGGSFAKSEADRDRLMDRWRCGQAQADQIVDKFRQQLECWRG